MEGHSVKFVKRWGLWRHEDGTLTAHKVNDAIVSYKGRPPVFVCEVEEVTEKDHSAVPPWIEKNEMLQKYSELSDKYMNLAEKYSKTVDQVILARETLEKLKLWGSQTKLIDQSLGKLRPW